MEWITNSGSQRQELRRTIGGFLIISEERLSPGAPSTNRKHQYLFHDHLGSVDVIVEAESLANGNQGVVDRKSYNAHGERREVPGGTGPWQNLIDPRTQPTTNDARTDRGFTGHEHVDRAGIVHMNGRLYDPLTGRMLSADPIVQEPFNLQNLNRYSYVLNNPLSYTDPTGLSFVRKYWRQIVATAIGVAMPHLFAWAKGLASAKLLTPALKFAAGVTGGFFKGVVGSGSLQGGLKGAFTGGLFAGIGNYAAAVGASGSIGHVLAHAVAGGVDSALQGGKFGHGFISAGVGKAASPWVDSLGGDGFGATLAEATVTGLIAGTVSVATGGKFGHGASTAAFAYALNQALTAAANSDVNGGWRAPMRAPQPVHVRIAVDDGVGWPGSGGISRLLTDVQSYFMSHGIPLAFPVCPCTGDALTIRIMSITTRSHMTRVSSNSVGEIRLNMANGWRVLAHEMAHAFGVADRYEDINGLSVPFPDYRGNLMGDLGTRLTLEQRNIILRNTDGGWQRRFRTTDFP